MGRNRLVGEEGKRIFAVDFISKDYDRLRVHYQTGEEVPFYEVG